MQAETFKGKKLNMLIKKSFCQSILEKKREEDKKVM